MTSNMEEKPGPSVVIKEEPVTSPIELEDTIVQLLSQFAEGMSDAELVKQLAGVDSSQRLTAINRLLTSAKIDLLRSGTTLMYKVKDTSVLDRVKGATAEETTVYQIIEESGRMGIWIKDIREQSHLSLAQMNKALKNLESRKLVKSVKTVGANRKKHYMLFELEPDSSLSGGSFYSDQEFDSQFADLLIDQCRRYLEGRSERAHVACPEDPNNRLQASLVSVDEVQQHITNLNISKIQLSVNDVERLLNALVYESCAEKVFGTSGDDKAQYRCVRWMLPICGATQIPCTFCPVIGDCRPGGTVSPESCVYFTDWLAQF